MLRLEGQVNGRRVARTCEDAAEVLAITSVLLDELPDLRVIRVLRTLETAAVTGRSWGWNSDEFSLTLHTA